MSIKTCSINHYTLQVYEALYLCINREFKEAAEMLLTCAPSCLPNQLIFITMLQCTGHVHVYGAV